MHKEQAGLQSEADDESGLAEGFGDSGDDAVERRQVRESERRGASAGGPVRAYRIVSHLTRYLAVASCLVFALYCFVAGVDACPIHHVRPLR